MEKEHKCAKVPGQSVSKVFLKIQRVNKKQSPIHGGEQKNQEIIEKNIKQQFQDFSYSQTFLGQRDLRFSIFQEQS